MKISHRRYDPNLVALHTINLVSPLKFIKSSGLCACLARRTVSTTFICLPPSRKLFPGIEPRIYDADHAIHIGRQGINSGFVVDTRKGEVFLLESKK
ncbi:hypothetical protein GWI33_005749 [Rhynchophorus ferrugineus]|uniref:Uncharacterized protein n=1 Tax=Rhynchophorus ferrugineus TaxID=354439 RepID=A0A834MFU1_RHYFE|nr:hypothetical protein GWI33_005749 [Rhynchophorus ferrugineus]